MEIMQSNGNPEIVYTEEEENALKITKRLLQEILKEYLDYEVDNEISTHDIENSIDLMDRLIDAQVYSIEWEC